ncbi:MAG: PLP-dependent aminotransferase family protein [Methylocystaceae bacterium]|nr:PLP-dependent aminotransferase family protein [Methylocystaceae bacterium]
MSGKRTKRHSLNLEIETGFKQARYLQLAATLIHEIKRARLKPHEKLPGTRTLAKTLALHRRTVDAAYQELISQGWLYTRPSSGTYVVEHWPVTDVPSVEVFSNEGNAEASSPNPDVNSLKEIDIVSDGYSDPRLLPHSEISSALRTAILSTRNKKLKMQEDPRGLYALREAICAYLCLERGIVTQPDNILVTRGSQMALYLIGLTQFKNEEQIAIEMPGYQPACDAFEATGSRVVHVRVDEEGLSVEELERIVLQNQNIRAVYVTPHHQYPTTQSMSQERRQALLKLAHSYNLLIIEDDYDHEFRYSGVPLLPLISQVQQDHRILHIGSFSKILFSGFRLGYIVGDADLISNMAQKRALIDRQGDYILEKAMSEMINDGVIYRHSNRARLSYKARLDWVADQLKAHLSDFLDFEKPNGGLAVWIRLKEPHSARHWIDEAAKKGLYIPPLSSFYAKGKVRDNAFRLGIADMNDDELKRLVSILKEIANQK